MRRLSCTKYNFLQSYVMIINCTIHDSREINVPTTCIFFLQSSYKVNDLVSKVPKTEREGHTSCNKYIVF